jgi:ADP-heptose:LPS heptosyltransferase
MPPVLIYRLGSLGDTVVALPCFHKIAEAFSTQPKIVITNLPVSRNAAPLEMILRPSGLIDGVIEYQVGVRSFRALQRLRKEIQASGSDTLVYLTAPRGMLSVLRDFLFFRACGIRKQIGVPWSRDLRSNRIDVRDGTEEPEAERLARTISGLGLVELENAASWDLRLTERERRRAGDVLAALGPTPFIAVNMGGKVADKDWGQQNWLDLVEKLAPELSTYALVIVGAMEDSSRANAVLALWHSARANVCGVLSPRETAALLAKAALFIGHDSGPLHLAAAMQAPCVGLFGGYNKPRKWHPYGARHRVLHDMRGVREIRVADAREAVIATLKAS